MSPSENAIARLNARAREHLKLKTEYEVLVTKNEESKKQFRMLEKKVQSLMDAFEDWQLKTVSLEKDIGVLEAGKKESENTKQEIKTKESEYEEINNEARRNNERLDPRFKKLLKDEIADLKKKAKGYLEIERKLAVKQDHFETAIKNQDQAQGKMKDLQNDIMNWTVNAKNACERDRVEFKRLASKESDECQKVDDKLRKEESDRQAKAKDLKDKLRKEESDRQAKAKDLQDKLGKEESDRQAKTKDLQDKLRNEDSDRRAKAIDLHNKLKEARDERGTIRTYQRRADVTLYPKRAKIVGEACKDMEALIKRIWGATPSGVSNS
jgi:hypothetical protein